MGGVAWCWRGANALGWGRLSFGIAVLAFGTSCSLEGLDRFPFPTCSDGRTGCEALNMRDGITDPNACMRWQCSAARECTFGLRDDDQDTYVAASCGGNDCEDSEPGAHPGAVESCDGADNDCNGVIDDIQPSMPPGTTPTSTVLTGASGPTFLDLADAPDGFYAVWDAAGQTRNALVTQTTAETPSTLLLGRTNADADRGLTDATAAVGGGCPDQIAIDLLPSPCSPTGTCPGSQICVTAPDSSRICEQPVLHRTPELAMECQTHAECSDGITCNGIETCEPRSGASLIDARGCRMRMPPTPCMGMGTCDEARDACIQPIVHPCDFRSMRASWAGDGELLTASINSDGCSAGRVRVGLVSSTDSPPAAIFWGGGALSTTWVGVDLDDSGCTGASRPVSELRGARQASIAALPRDPTASRDSTEALAAWIAAPAASTGPAPVEILGLWREQLAVAADTVRFVDGAGDGHPLRLTDATTSEHVGVASYALGAAAGYLVAYARDGGGVSVSTLAHLGPVADACAADPACISKDAGPDGILGTADDGNPTTSITRAADPLMQPPRTTPAMGTPTSSVLDMTTTVVGDVSVAVGTPQATDPPTTTLPVALAWASSTEVVVALASINSATHVLTDGTRLRIAAAGARDVRIVHVEAGVSLAGQFSAGTITATEVGGFVVTWVTNAGTFAARVSDHTGDLLAPGAVLLGDPSDTPLAFVDYDDAGANPRVRVAAHQGDAVVVFPNVCGPPTP